MRQLTDHVQGHRTSPLQSEPTRLDSQAGKQRFLQGSVIRHHDLLHIPHPTFTGTRQAYLPGGLRTGAPGKHVVKGKSKYRLLDEQVRYFVAPPIQDIVNSPVRRVSLGY